MMVITASLAVKGSCIVRAKPKTHTLLTFRHQREGDLAHQPLCRLWLNRFVLVCTCNPSFFRTEGVQALFRGVGVTLLRAIPMHGLVFVGYEATIDFLGARSEAANA